MADLQIKNVDLDLLEKQRLSLMRAINRFMMPSCLESDKAMVEDLVGIENMLNVWSDSRHFEEE